MHKIQYLQSPWGGIKNSSTDSFIGSVTSDFNKKMLDLSKFSLDPIKAQFKFGQIGNTLGQNQLAMSAFSTKTNLWKNRVLGSSDDTKGSIDIKKPLISKADGKQLGNAALSIAPQLGEAIIGAAGGREADNISGGEQVFSKGTDVAWGAAVKTGNPLAIGIAGGLKGLDWINRYGGSTAKTQGTADMNITGYGTQVNDQAGKKNTVIGGLSRKTGKANALTNTYDTRNLLAGNASQTSLQNIQSGIQSAQDVDRVNDQALKGTQGSTKLLAAKEGTKINPAKLRNLTKKVKKPVKKEVDKFQEGGKMNVIPEGALHKNLNHYEGELGESVTSKGIPVITKSKGGDIDQHAEIEKNEVIFHKEATDKMEAWFKQYNEADGQKEKDQIAIKCGKYTTEELLENTQDNTGLIETV